MKESLYYIRIKVRFTTNVLQDTQADRANRETITTVK